MFREINFSEAYENYSESEKFQFQQCVQRLLSVTFINKNKGDVTKWDENYLFILKKQADFEEYFSYCGIEMQVYDSLQVVSVESKFPSFRKRLNKVTTLYCLALRLIYDEKLKEFTGNDQVIIRSADFFKKLTEYGITEKKVNMQEYVSVMRSLSKNGIVLKNKGKWEDIDTTFTLYPTITLLLPEQKLKDIVSSLKMDMEVNNDDQVE